MFREKIYERKNWKGVVHTTWNPKGPGVIRIHMIPPKFHLFKMIPSIAIVNGQYYLPVNESWAILLTEFIRHVNTYGEHEMDDEQLQMILSDSFHQLRNVYPEVSDERLKSDLALMVDVFEAVANGEEPPIEIDAMGLSEYAPFMKAPHRMDLMVSSMSKDGQWKCNQKCLHCYAANQPMAETEELTTEEWKKIIEKCKAAGISQLTFTGGEPTMRKDLFALIASARWFVTRLNTNGVLLTKDFCEKLTKADLDSVQITFYSKDAKVHNQLVGAENYDKTVEGIKNAIAAGLNVSVNTPLCTLNKNYHETLEFLHTLGIEYVTCSGLIVTGNATKDASVKTQLSKEELRQVLQEATIYCYENGMEIDFTSPGWLAEEELKEMGLQVPSCGACLSNMAIAPNGDVVPCQSWLSEDCLGNMRNDSWKKIWNSKKCKEQRQHSAKTLGICPLREKAGDAK